MKNLFKSGKKSYTPTVKRQGTKKTATVKKSSSKKCCG